MQLVPTKWAVERSASGTAVVYVVDEHGCRMNTEPVVVVPAPQYHAWFESWLVQQPCPYMGVELLWHPMLGETSDTYQAAVVAAAAAADPESWAT